MKRNIEKTIIYGDVEQADEVLEKVAPKGKNRDAKDPKEILQPERDAEGVLSERNADPAV
jgi:hypothetical protein